MKLRCDFEQCEHLGDREMPEFEPFDAVSCMFAIHYFFAREEMLSTFLGNVAGSLKAGEARRAVVELAAAHLHHLASATGRSLAQQQAACLRLLSLYFRRLLHRHRARWQAHHGAPGGDGRVGRAAAQARAQVGGERAGHCLKL